MSTTPSTQASAPVGVHASEIARARHEIEHPSPERIRALQANLDMAQSAVHTERQRNRELLKKMAELEARCASLEAELANREAPSVVTEEDDY